MLGLTNDGHMSLSNLRCLSNGPRLVYFIKLQNRPRYQKYHFSSIILQSLESLQSQQPFQKYLFTYSSFLSKNPLIFPYFDPQTLTKYKTYFIKVVDLIKSYKTYALFNKRNETCMHYHVWNEMNMYFSFIYCIFWTITCIFPLKNVYHHFVRVTKFISFG